jgi:hypothetical protein
MGDLQTVSNLVYYPLEINDFSNNGKKFGSRWLNNYFIIDEITIVQLNQETFMICDTSDWDLLKQYTWHFNKTNGYCYCFLYTPNKERFSFHSKIMNDLKDVDHINRNKLDNRRINLFHCGDPIKQRSIQLRNRKMKLNNITGEKNIKINKNSIEVEITVKYKGIRKKKQFSIAKYGFENALQLARDAKEEMIQRYVN